LYWPDLDVDLHIDSIEDPERYPVVSKGSPIKRVQRTGQPLARPAGRGQRRATGRR
jgi:hypothetical protein